MAPLKLFALLVVGFVLAPAPGAESAASAIVALYVGPIAAGNTTGSAVENAADFRDPGFWRRIQPALASGDVTVTFLPGRYVVSSDPTRKLPPLQLADLGSDAHTLTLQADVPDTAVFTRRADDSRADEKGPGFLFLKGCRHVVVRNLEFTAPHMPIGYATNFGGNQHIRIENCHWHDLDGVYYGATGTARETTEDITFEHCRFERVGSGPHAHMIYNAYGPRHIRVIDCQFEDCAGDYVRFRDRTDYGVVTGCTFHSTGKFTGVHSPFISVPLFNDDDPAAHKRNPGYEYFGTHFLIRGNRFIYDTDAKPAARIAVVFHHSGFSPPGAEFLLDAAGGRVLREGSTAEKKALLLSRLHIDSADVHVYANELTRVAHAGVYQCQASYGAKPQGGEGTYDIADAFNAVPVSKDVERDYLR